LNILNRILMVVKEIFLFCLLHYFFLFVFLKYLAGRFKDLN